jgi:Tfp pilus assembly protein PilX
MRYIFYIRSNERGSTLLISILILLLLTVIGIAATNTSTIEILISGNDKVHKMAFHQADGGTEVGIELVEQNINLAGFNTSELTGLRDVNATNPNLYMNGTPSMPSDTNRDAYLPKNYTGNEPHTNLTIGGKSSAGGGSYVVYDIWSQHIGKANSEAIILLQWMHVM